MRGKEKKSFFKKSWDFLNTPIEDLVSEAYEKIKNNAKTLAVASALAGSVMLSYLPVVYSEQQQQPQNQQYDIKKVEKIKKMILDNEVALFNSALDARDNNNGVDICNIPPQQVNSKQDNKKTKTSTFARDVFNPLGLYKEPNSVILPEIRTAVSDYMSKYVNMHNLNVQIEKDKIYVMRKEQNIQQAKNASNDNSNKKEFLDVIYETPLKRLTANTGNSGGKLHILFHVPDTKAPDGYCITLHPQLLQYVDENLINQKINGSASSNQQSEGASPPTQQSGAQTQQGGSNSGQAATPTQSGGDNQSGGQPITARINNTAQTKKFGITAGGLVMPWTEKYSVKSVDEFGVEIQNTETSNPTYAGGFVAVGVKPFDWLVLDAYSRILSASGNPKITEYEWAVGPTLLIKDVGQLSTLLSGLERKIELSDNELEASKKLSLMGGTFGFSSVDLLKNSDKVIQLFATYKNMSGKEDTDLKIDLSMFGAPDVEQSMSDNYTLSSFNAGLEVYPFSPILNGKGALGFLLSAGYSKIGDKNSEGLTMTTIDPRVIFRYGGKNSDIELFGGYSLLFPKSDDETIEYKNAGYGIIGVNVNYGNNTLRPLKWFR